MPLLPDVPNDPATASALHDLVVANRILAEQGVLDAFGHVSVRHPSDASRFVIARSLAPEQVTEADLQVFTFDGTRVGGHPGTPYAERAIHAAVYEARPDVLAVCHNHSPSTIPFGVTGVRLRPIFHVAGLLGTEVPVWEPRAEFGDTDMLVRSLEHGRSLARTLGSQRVALMRGHGSVVGGATLREVVFCSVYLERNAQLQLQAQALGPVTFLSPGEVRQALEWLRQPLAQERAWGAWAARAGVAPTGVAPTGVAPTGVAPTA